MLRIQSRPSVSAQPDFADGIEWQRHRSAVWWKYKHPVPHFKWLQSSKKKNLRMQTMCHAVGRSVWPSIIINFRFADNPRPEKCFLHGEEESRREGVRSKLSGAVGVQCSLLLVLSDHTVVKSTDANWTVEDNTWKQLGEMILTTPLYS